MAEDKPVPKPIIGATVGVEIPGLEGGSRQEETEGSQMGGAPWGPLDIGLHLDPYLHGIHPLVATFSLFYTSYGSNSYWSCLPGSATLTIWHLIMQLLSILRKLPSIKCCKETEISFPVEFWI